MNFIRKLALTLIVAFGSSGPVLAQQPPALTIAPSHLEAAKDVVLNSGIAITFKGFVPQLADQTVISITRTRPEVRADLIVVLQELIPEFEKRTSEMVDSTARAFAGAMDETALKATAAFFKSDAGKKYVQMQPLVINQMVVSLEAWNRQMSTEMVERVRVEMRKKGHNI